MFYQKTKKNNLRYTQGQVMLVLVIFFLVVSSTIVFGIANPILKQVRISKDLFYSKQGLALANSSLEDISYRFKNNKQVAGTEVLSGNGGYATTTITNIATGKQIVSISNVQNDIRKMQADVTLGTGISFHYGIQSGQGGFFMSNSSSIIGNVFSGGTIIGTNTNNIYGDVISSGSSGLVYGIHATGTVWSHIIGNAVQATTIDKDAYYYTTKTNTTVTGVSYPNSADQPVADLPISDAQITAWESDALAGGIMTSGQCDSYSSSSNTCTISSSQTIGPKKIPFNLLIKSSNGIVTVAGPLWIAGNLTTQTGPTIQMASGLGSSNVAVIADNPANTTGSGIIDIGQSTIFKGSGSAGSFVFIISQNNSAETGGSTDALTMSQGSSALVAYASHGQITLSQSVSVREATAYKIVLTQSANVTYDTGLPSLLFQAGPSGGYDIQDWMEIQ